MKYIKLFEAEVDKQLEIGDYVLIDAEDYFDPLYNSYLSVSIGKVLDIKITNKIPLQFRILVEFDEDCVDRSYTFANPTWFNSDEILKYSSEKEDIEVFTHANKYNL